jgi:hypothetical protein
MRYIDAMARPQILTVKKLIAMSPELVHAIENYRFSNHIGSEADAIRRLIDLGLKAAKAEKPKRAK